MMGPSRSCTKSKMVLVVMVMVVLGTLMYYRSSYTISFPDHSSFLISHLYSLERRGEEPLWWKDVLCKDRDTNLGEPLDIPVLQLFRDVTPEKNKNVFLMDTACNSNPKYRVWCSVESWARQNPDRQVWFLLTSGKLNSSNDLPLTLLKQYVNLHMVTADLNDMFKGTPLVYLFNSRNWAKENTWPVELLSDMLRVLVLWWWGGVYSDTDVISVRNLTLPPNSLGFESKVQIGSAFYSFTAHHPALLDLMEDMQRHFKPRVWGCIGPRAITRVMQKLCGVHKFKLINEVPFTCKGNITLHPVSTFFPIDYGRFKTYFKPGGGRAFKEKFGGAYALHFWNKMSKLEKVEVNQSSIYEVAAKNFCPVTYRIATAHSNFF